MRRVWKRKRQQRTYRYIRNNIMICFSTQIALMHCVANKLLTRGTTFCHARNVIANVLCSVEMSLTCGCCCYRCCHGNRPTFSYKFDDCVAPCLSKEWTFATNVCECCHWRCCDWGEVCVERWKQAIVSFDVCGWKRCHVWQVVFWFIVCVCASHARVCLLWFCKTLQPNAADPWSLLKQTNPNGVVQ